MALGASPWVPVIIMIEKIDQSVPGWWFQMLLFYIGEFSGDNIS